MNLDTRMEKIRRDIRDLVASDMDARACQVLEDLRQAIELCADQVFDISHNRLPEVEANARAAARGASDAA